MIRYIIDKVDDKVNDKVGDKVGDKVNDKVTIKNFLVSAEEINAAVSLVGDELKQAIEQAKGNIEKFHSTQVQPEEPVETMPGIKCWRKSLPIEKVGLYIPGGSAPLFSTLLMFTLVSTNSLAAAGLDR